MQCHEQEGGGGRRKGPYRKTKKKHNKTTDHIDTSEKSFFVITFLTIFSFFLNFGLFTTHTIRALNQGCMGFSPFFWIFRDLGFTFSPHFCTHVH